MVLGWAPLPLVVVIPWVRSMSTRQAGRLSVLHVLECPTSPKIDLMLALHGLHGFSNCILLIYGLILLFGSVVFLTHLVEHSLLFC